METYIVMTDANHTVAYRVLASNVRIETMVGDSHRDVHGQLRLETQGKKIELLTTQDPERIELSDELERRLAHYNLEQQNRLLLNEIRFHKHQIKDLRREIGRIKDAAGRLKRSAREILWGYLDEEVLNEEDLDEEED